MKLKFKVVLVLLTSVILFYTACKKSSETTPALSTAPTPPVNPPSPGTSTVAESTVSSLIAINIAQTLAGNYGGINLSDGIMMPDFLIQYSRLPLGINLVDLCSFFPDTIAKYNSPPGDTVKSTTTGLFKFYFSCDTLKAPRVNGSQTFTFLDGYSAYDSLATRGVAPKDSFNYNVKAFYTARAQDTVNIPFAGLGSANKLLTFNGGVKSFVDITATTKPVNPSSIHVYYTLKNLTMDLTQSKNITGGSATFGASGVTNKMPWTYSGSITFLGNNKVNITINTLTYNVDMTTGVATAGTGT